MKKSSIRKKAAASTAAILTAASLAVSGLVDSPDALLEDKPRPETVIAMPAPPAEDDPDAELAEDADPEEKRGIRASLRRRILAMPLLARLFFVLPIWALGSAICFAGSLLFSGLSPLLAQILSGVLLTAVLIGAFLLSAKAIFPDLPVKKLLNRRTLPWLLLGSIALTDIDLLLGFFWPSYGNFRQALRAAGLLAALSAGIFGFVRRETRRRKSAPLNRPDQKRKGQLVFEDAEGNSFSVTPK